MKTMPKIIYIYNWFGEVETTFLAFNSKSCTNYDYYY